MSPEALRVRLEKLERRVDILEQLPDRVSALEVQIVRLRDEMRSEFSETRSRDGDTRRVLNERMDSLSVTRNSAWTPWPRRLASRWCRYPRH